FFVGEVVQTSGAHASKNMEQLGVWGGPGPWRVKKLRARPALYTAVSQPASVCRSWRSNGHLLLARLRRRRFGRTCGVKQPGAEGGGGTGPRRKRRGRGRIRRRARRAPQQDAATRQQGGRREEEEEEEEGKGTETEEEHHSALARWQLNVERLAGSQ
ncbi:unnamed protein product, partial [Prorocentrum cordatum]